MQDLIQILEAIEAARRLGRPGVLATVVRIAGSAYRRPGARMFLPAGAPPTGLVSGGCLEGDLAERAEQVTASQEARTVVYDMRSPDDIVWGLGLGCNGEIRVLLEYVDPVTPPPYVGFLRELLGRRGHGVVVSVFESEGDSGVVVGDRFTVDAGGNFAGPEVEPALAAAIVADARQTLTSGRSAVRTYERETARLAALIEHIGPSPQLVVFGAGLDAVPVVRLAAELRWRVTVLDHRPAVILAERFPEADDVRLVDYRDIDETLPTIDARTPVVVMTHHFLNDAAVLTRLLETPAPYIGLLGPRQRADNLLAELQKNGVEVDPQQRRRLYGPVGLDIGAETPHEIALALLAEIQAVLAARDGGFLRERSTALHDWPVDPGSVSPDRTPR